MDETISTTEVRVATLNLWGRRGAWEERGRVLLEDIRENSSDLTVLRSVPLAL